MSISVYQVEGAAIEPLIPILLQAEQSEEALRWSLNHMADAVYRMDQESGQIVAAATLQWQKDRPEIIELAVAPDQQRRGYGRQMLEWIIAEGRRRGKAEILVGTANSSIDNIVFYQKCGFRMDHIRQNYFWYYDQQQYEDGLPILDMLVFRYQLIEQAEDETGNHRRRRGWARSSTTPQKSESNP